MHTFDDPTTSRNSSGNNAPAADDLMVGLERLLAQGKATIERNPTLAIVGGASVVALLILAAKRSASTKEPVSSFDLGRLQEQVRQMSMQAGSGATTASAAFAEFLAKVTPSDPETIANVKSAVADALRPYTDRVKHFAQTTSA